MNFLTTLPIQVYDPITSDIPARRRAEAASAARRQEEVVMRRHRRIKLACALSSGLKPEPVSQHRGLQSEA